MTPAFRAVPPSPAQLAADADSPHILFIDADRDALAIATSESGLGIDLVGPVPKLTASTGDLERLLEALKERLPGVAAQLERYLKPQALWQLRTRELALEQGLIMGILNLTTDSFSGDGVGVDTANAVARAEELRAAGADVIDVGAESARADRPVLNEEHEAALVAEVVGALVREGHAVSCDSYKAAVAKAALQAGAEAVNDISGLTLGMGAASEAAAAGAGYVLNYSYSVPKRRPDSVPEYDDVVAETVAWLESRTMQLLEARLKREQVVIDPGIAFGKSHDEDLQVLRRLGEFRSLGLPVLLAHSRKNFIGSVSGGAPSTRDLETHVVTALAFEQGARIFRVHDPAGTRRALDMAAAIAGAQSGDFAPGGGSWPWRAGADAPHMTREDADREAPAGQRW